MVKQQRQLGGKRLKGAGVAYHERDNRVCLTRLALAITASAMLPSVALTKTHRISDYEIFRFTRPMSGGIEQGACPLQTSFPYRACEKTDANKLINDRRHNVIRIQAQIGQYDISGGMSCNASICVMKQDGLLFMRRQRSDVVDPTRCLYIGRLRKNDATDQLLLIGCDENRNSIYLITVAVRADP